MWGSSYNHLKLFLKIKFCWLKSSIKSLIRVSRTGTWLTLSAPSITSTFTKQCKIWFEAFSAWQSNFFKPRRYTKGIQIIEVKFEVSRLNCLVCLLYINHEMHKWPETQKLIQANETKDVIRCDMSRWQLRAQKPFGRRKYK